jgi:hypothetical protein
MRFAVDHREGKSNQMSCEPYGSRALTATGR